MLLHDLDGRPVVCAVGDDDLAPTVLRTAAALARELDVPLTVVHSPYADVFLTGERYLAALEEGRAFLERLTRGYHVDELVVETGAPDQLILEIAEQGASLIVLGTQGRTRLQGGTSQAVLANARSPVVTISAAAAHADAVREEQPVAAGASAQR